MIERTLHRLWMALCVAAFCAICFEAHAQDCGIVNGVYYCTETPGCGIVNGVKRCAEPPGCGHVNGAYVCDIAEEEPQNQPAPPGVLRPRTGDAEAPNAGVVAGLEWMAGFFSGKGADDWMSSAISWGVKKATVAYLETKLWAMKIAWSVGEEIIDGLGIMDMIMSRAAALPADLYAAAAYFGIWTALNILLTAAAASFAMRFVPGL